MKSQSSVSSPARLVALATSVPRYEIEQSDVEAFGRRLFRNEPQTFQRLSGAYANAGIERRYSCVPLEWYEDARGWKDRTRLFVENAVVLLQEAAKKAMTRAKVDEKEIDGIVTICSTGLAVPSLDALLMERMAFRRDIQRLPVFGLGCAGGVLGLTHAATMARATPGSRWLLLVVELCGLTFRSDDLSKSNIIATALFGDGAAAAILTTDGDGSAVIAGGEYCWPKTLDIMGWNIEEDGFGVRFSRDIPNLVRTELRHAADAFLSNSGLSIETVDNYVFHPGGAKVLDALEDAFAIPSPGLIVARDVLRNYGNMSASTVLFILERCRERGINGRSFLAALGPGFTAGFAVLDDS
ncbi:MAG: Alpha-pyrone synthesis polyketide synthase-like Pks11 [Alphaproteobacteria bacterium MarineAlpha4_Bin2]|nr:MAG: Alpha-pyrone synthesis polyketide synthase-like Pks11 [Alphaproteobacteria bacterium MarineAlpha4_Bin2]